jgi:hypothetical protein
MLHIQLKFGVNDMTRENEMKKVFLAISILLSGCTTIHFDNGSIDTNAQVQEKWHHNYLFALIEGSAPINLENECEDKEWSSVKTELSFINVLASFPVNLLGPIWFPKTVDISCE